MRRLFIVFALGTGLPLQGQAPRPSVSGTDLRADLGFLLSVYQDLHPGLYRYNSHEEVRDRFDSLARSLSDSLSLAEAYLDVARLVATIRCGHSYPNFWNQSKAVAGALYLNTGRVPFLFRWLEGKMVVTRDLSGAAKFPPGTVIREINGIASARIGTELLRVARADGHNDAKRLADIELTGMGKYEAFDVYFPLLFPPPPGPWRYRIVQPDGSKQSVSVVPLTRTERAALLPEMNSGDSLPGWVLRDLSGGVRHLRMNTWALYNTSWDWQAYLDSVFMTLTGDATTGLVVDLRGNEGGLDVGNRILAHLIDRPLHLSRYRRLVRYREVPDSFRPALDTWDTTFFNWGGDAHGPDSLGFYTLTRFDDDSTGDVIAPVAPRYPGRVAVLIGAANSSATFQFAQSLQREHLGLLVGQPTGGNRRGINGGAFFFLRLPQTGIEVDVPLIGTFPLAPEPDQGIEPDLTVRVTAREIALGRDPALEAAVRALTPSR